MSSTIYSFLKQIHPPTAVEHCLYCNFYNSSERNLIVAGTTVLRVFRLAPDLDQNSSNAEIKLKLECVQVFSLFGNIMSIQAIRLIGSCRDALLLSFKEAKLSVVEYDPSTHDLKTLSLHYFEEEDMKLGSTQHPFVPLLRVDPDGRCAAMIVYERNIVILPFRKDTATEEPEIVSNNSTSLLGGKSPVLSSYTIKLADIDEKVNNIKDLQFLQGYYEPTLLILYEPLKTWPGRIAVRQDTCAILALSLNLNQKVHPVIWSVSGLPFDCLYSLPVPKPIGGVLIVAVNSLLYLNQSVPPYGVSMNAFTEFGTNFPLKNQEGLKTTLDCSNACFISYDKLVISLKGGELYVLTLFNDGMRSVRAFKFDRAASSVLTTCMTLCEDGYLFLGSRIGNSLLLKYTEKVDIGGADDEDVPIGEKPLKRLRQDTMGDWMASDVNLIEDPDELEVYGNETQTTKQLTSYSFEVCDSLLNIGPCGKICMGEPAFLSEEFSGSQDPDLELVTTSGYGKNGALSVLQRSVRPQVVTTFHLPGCVDMWTVIGLPSDNQAQIEKSVLDDPFLTDVDKIAGAADDDSQHTARPQPLTNSHSFLILSRPDSTMILQTGQEINELDHSGFSTQAPTVCAGNVGNNRFVVQVSPMGVRLLAGSRQLQHIPLDVGSPIVWASIADPYIMIMSAEGMVIQLMLKLAEEDSGNARLSVSRPQLAQVKSRVLTLCVYKDLSGLFTTSAKANIKDPKSTLSAPPAPTEINEVLRLNNDMDDDEDALLYGTPLTKIEKEKIELQIPIKRSRAKFEVKDVTPTYWLFVVRENGVLEIYSLPNYKLCYLVKNFTMGQKFLVDSGQVAASVSGLLSSDKSEKQNDALPVMQELLVVGLGHRHSRPILLARVDDDLLIYEAFPYYESGSDNHLKLRFRKMYHEIITRERKFVKGRRKEEEESVNSFQRKLRFFEDISGYNGVFICGLCPFWLFLTSHGELRTHPMSIDGETTCFAPFHNINCPKGFLYFNKEGHLRICVLPTHLMYDAPWPVRKVPLRCTPHYINYHVETKTYLVVTSNMEVYDKLIKFSGDEKEVEPIERTDERYIFPTTERFSAQLFSPVSWEIIPNTLIELEEWEHVTCVRNVLLLSEGTRSGLKGFLAIGTNYTYGEDVTSRGRILILDIIEVVPEPGQPLTKNKIKVLYSKEQKGPVTAMAQVSGLLVTAIGQKVYMWQLKDNDLIGVAFIDTQIYIHCIISLKNLIIVSDISKSISLLRYQEDSRTLSLVSRDVKLMDVYGAEFVIDNNQVGFLVSDLEKNLVLFMYHPEARESFGGMKLLRKADIHLGHNILSFFRIRCRIGDAERYDKRQSMMLERRHITMFATLDGSLGYMVPVPEKTYRRLLMLQNILGTQIPHTGGLNPKGFRMYKSHKKVLQNPHKNILDGDLLYKFSNLSILEKNELSKRIGTSSGQIIDDLLEIAQSSAYF